MSQAIVRVLLAMIPVLVPVNFSFPPIPSSIHGFVEHLGQGPGIHRASWDEFAGSFGDGEAAELQASRRGVRLQLGRSTTLRIIVLTTCDGVQSLLYRCRRALHHPGDVAQSRTLVSHPPALIDLLRWASNTFPASPSSVQA